MYCTKCGKEINGNEQFCPSCGQRLTEEDAQGGQKSSPKKGHKLIGVGIAALIVAGVGCFMVFGKPFAENDPSSAKEKKNDEAVETVSEVDESDLEAALDLIDQAELILDQSNKDVENSVGENSSQKMQNKADVMKKAADDLKQLQGECLALKRLNPNCADACKDYFEMAVASREGYQKNLEFYAKYFTFDATGRPKQNSYEKISDYDKALNEWYETNKQVIDSIENIPSCVEAEWTAYKKLFELTDDIVMKEYNAVQLNDFLRHYSAINLNERYEVAEELGYQALLNCSKGEIDFANTQMNVAKKLAEEIHSYADGDSEQRAQYEFANNRNSKIVIQYDAIEDIYPSLYDTYNSFVILKTGCMSGNRKITVEAEIPGFTQKYKQSFDLDSSYQSIYIKPAPLTGDIDLTSSKSAQMNVSVYEKDGTTLIESKTFPVNIKSKNDFVLYTSDFGAATKVNLLSFLTPDAQAITELKRNAIDEIIDMTGGKIESFVGYQETGYNHYVGTYLQAAGIMRALYDMGVRYNMDGFSVDDYTQHILLPEEVLNSKSGLCIETSLTVASALQSAGFNTYLILPTGHAQVAVEVWDKDYKDREGNVVRGEGHGEYFLIETTSLSDNSNNASIYRDYANALIAGDPDELSTDAPISYLSASEWKQYIDGNNVYVIDCGDSSLLGLTPFAN